MDASAQLMVFGLWCCKSTARNAEIYRHSHTLLDVLTARFYGIIGQGEDNDSNAQDQTLVHNRLGYVKLLSAGTCNQHTYQTSATDLRDHLEFNTIKQVTPFILYPENSHEAI